MERLRYNEIRSLFVNRLDSVWMEDSTTEVTRANVDKKMEEDLGHATEMLSALWEIANEDDNAINKVEDTETPPNPSPTVSYFRVCYISGVIRGCLLHNQVAKASPKKKKKRGRGTTTKPTDTSSLVSPPRFYLSPML